MNSNHKRFLGVGWVSATLMLFVIMGCEQPIHQALHEQPAELQLNLSDARNEAKHNWPVRDNQMTIAKPPPMAYPMSYSEPLVVSPLELPDPATWQTPEISAAARVYLKDLFDPFPTQLNWTGEIPAEEFAGPQAFDLTIDGKRLVTVAGTRFALFDATTGKQVGSRELPGDWSGGDPTAIRFAPTTKDFIVASAQKLCRISSKDGTLIAEIDGPGESIKKWIVADDESFMVLLTESGKLFAGDAALQSLEPLKLPATNPDAVFDDVGMSFDGVRIQVLFNNQPRTYLQEDGRIVDYIDHSPFELTGPVVIGSGLRDDVWLTPKAAVYTMSVQDPDSVDGFGLQQSVAKKISAAPDRETGVRQMFWNVASLQMVRKAADKGNEWLIGVSQRNVQGKPQWVVYDVNVKTRFNSVPVPLEQKPERLLADRWGTQLVIATQDSIRLASWEAWRTRRSLNTQFDAVGLCKQGDFESFEMLLDYLHEQDRWTHIGCSQDALANLVTVAANDWATLLEQEQIEGAAFTDEGRKTLQRYQDWYAKGGFWARTIHAKLRSVQSWRARNDTDRLGGDLFERYDQRRTEALEELEMLLKEERPAALTLGLYVGCYLERRDDLETMDQVCRRCVDLHPRSIRITGQMGFKLLPQWYGEVGDCLSYLNSHARIYEQPFDALMYAMLIGDTGIHVGENPKLWQTLDVAFLNRGVEYAIQQEMAPMQWFYDCMKVYRLTRFAPEQFAAMRGYIRQTTAVMPEQYVPFAEFDN